jgi:6-phosphogluconolactonase
VLRVAGRPETVIGKDAEAVAAAAAARLAELAAAAPRAPFTVALAGGSTPRRLYELLAAEPLAARVPWERVECFFGDERAVAPDHPDSNFRMASEALLGRVPVTAHRMAAEAGDAGAYERLLAERIPARREGVPVLDLVLLGVGEDGHTASLFPGTRALGERMRWVVMNDVPQLGTRRMTFTFRLINAAARVWILATGARKQRIVAACLGAEGGEAGAWPVRDVRPAHGELVWWLDEAAAGGAGGPGTA